MVKRTKALQKILNECRIRYECEHCEREVITRYATNLGFKLCLKCFLIVLQVHKQTAQELSPTKKLFVGRGGSPKPSKDSRKRLWAKQAS